MTCLLRAIWKSSSLLVFLLALANYAQAENELGGFLKNQLGVSGSLRSGVWEHDKTFHSPSGYWVNGIWLQARPQEIKGFRFHFDGRLQAPELTRSSYSNLDLREAYVEKSVSDFDFRFGRQIIVWGRADKVNPTDVWSVRDYTLLTPDDEDQLTGVLGGQGIWNLGNFRLIGVWMPEWRAPKLPTGSLPAGTSISDGDASDKINQWGVKLDHNGGELDWSVSYAHAIDRNPDLKMASVNGSGTHLLYNFQKTELWGFDFAKTLGSYGFRGEAAYLRTSDHTGEDPLTKNSSLYSVFGLEKSFFSDLNLNLQYVYRHAFQWRSSESISNPATKALADQVDILSNQRKANFHAGTFRANYKLFNETLESELVLFGTFSNGLIRPKVTYSFTDQFKGILGAEFYRGTPDSFFGRLRDYSSGFLELRWGF